MGGGFWCSSLKKSVRATELKSPNNSSSRKVGFPPIPERAPKSAQNRTFYTFCANSAVLCTFRRSFWNRRKPHFSRRLIIWRFWLCGSYWSLNSSRIFCLYSRRFRGFLGSVKGLQDRNSRSLLFYRTFAGEQSRAVCGSRCCQACAPLSKSRRSLAFEVEGSGSDVISTTRPTEIVTMFVCLHVCYKA